MIEKIKNDRLQNSTQARVFQYIVTRNQNSVRDLFADLKFFLILPSMATLCYVHLLSPIELKNFKLDGLISSNQVILM